MELETQADITATPAVAPESQAPAPSQPHPLQSELDKIEEHKSGRTRREKLEYTKQRVEQQLRELDGEVGTAVPAEIDKSKPLTFADYERLQREQENTRAVDLAESITDEVERKLVIHYLENTIKPSGNAENDLGIARAIVNAKRNGQIAEEAARMTRPNGFAASPGAPAKPPEDIFEPTAEEASMMRAPFNLTKEDVLRARRANQK